MNIQPDDLAKRLLRSEWDRLSHHERAVITKVLEVNLRAELGVRALVDRLDELQRTNHEQLELLRRFPAAREGEPPSTA